MQKQLQMSHTVRTEASKSTSFVENLIEMIFIFRIANRKRFQFEFCWFPTVLIIICYLSAFSLTNLVDWFSYQWRVKLNCSARLEKIRNNNKVIENCSTGVNALHRIRIWWNMQEAAGKYLTYCYSWRELMKDWFDFWLMTSWFMLIA